MINNQVVATSTTLVAGAAVLAYLGFQFFQKRKTVKIPTKWEEVGTLSGLYLYPLKSGHRKELNQAECTPLGLKQTEQDEKVLQLRDRGLVVYTEKDNEFRTARTYPQLLQIDISVHDENHFALDAPTMRTLYVKIPSKETNKSVTITLHRAEPCNAIDCGEEAATWLSRLILEKPTGLRLGFHDGVYKRDLQTAYKKDISFYQKVSNLSAGLYPDLTSMSLINQASVNDLCQKIGNGTVSVHNFRPNLVVNGPTIKAFDEDNWEWIKIGDVIMRNVKECTRCMLTTLNPDTSMRDPAMEPLTTLKTYRKCKGPGDYGIMGVHLEVRQTGLLKLGDTVYIHRSEE
ncbi:unnamed protein product [Diabrotica balteata]|nr:unnamed protein product [Diabrotica balteata]